MSFGALKQIDAGVLYHDRGRSGQIMSASALLAANRKVLLQTLGGWWNC